ncbi:DNA polymerase III subunit beta family protein [Kitasatospora cineracea]
MSTATRVQAHHLATAITRTKPHISKDDTLDVLNGIHFETNGNYLYTIATDRYTFAINRTDVVNGQPWTAHLREDDIPIVLAWLDRHDEDAYIEINTEAVGSRTDLVLSSLIGTLRSSDPTVNRRHFPDWRTMVRKILATDQAVNPLTAFNSRYLARFKVIGSVLHSWQAGPRKPLVLTDNRDFIGLVMPAPDEKVTRDGLVDNWAWHLKRTEANVLGASFDLTVEYRDRHGDPWRYSGKDGQYGEPLMELVGIDDDPWPLLKVIDTYGPLSKDEPIAA